MRNDDANDVLNSEQVVAEVSNSEQSCSTLENSSVLLDESEADGISCKVMGLSNDEKDFELGENNKAIEDDRDLDAMKDFDASLEIEKNSINDYDSSDLMGEGPFLCNGILCGATPDEMMDFIDRSYKKRFPDGKCAPGEGLDFVLSLCRGFGKLMNQDPSDEIGECEPYYVRNEFGELDLAEPPLFKSETGFFGMDKPFMVTEEYIDMKEYVKTDDWKEMEELEGRIENFDPSLYLFKMKRIEPEE